MANEGYYRSDGLQNSGTALQYGGGNVYIYTNNGSSNFQIYPREITVTLNNGNFGSFELNTYRTVGRWRTCAYQGAKSSTQSAYSAARICYGHIVPSNIPRFSNLLRVDYCRIGYQAHHCGIHGINRTLSFNVATNNDAVPHMIYRYECTLGANTDSAYHREEGGNGSSLCTFMYHLLTSGSRICLHNDETTYNTGSSYYDGTGYGSTNYAAIESFAIEELRVTYQP